MPRFLRVGNEMIHVASLSSTTIGTTCLGQPLLTLSFHATKSVVRVRYNSWESCQHDFNRIKNAVNEVEELLNKVPLTEPEVVKAADIVVEQKMIELKESIDTMDTTIKESVKSLETTSSPK